MARTLKNGTLIIIIIIIIIDATKALAFYAD